MGKTRKADKDTETSKAKPDQKMQAEHVQQKTVKGPAAKVAKPGITPSKGRGLFCYRCLAACFSGGKLWKNGEMRHTEQELDTALWEKVSG